MDSSQGGKLPSSKSNMSYLGSFGLQRAMLLLARGADVAPPAGMCASVPPPRLVSERIQMGRKKINVNKRAAPTGGRGGEGRRQ